MLFYFPFATHSHDSASTRSTATNSRLMSSVTKTDPAFIQATKIKAAGQKAWVSDPATYPVIATCVIAVIGAGSFIGYKFTYCEDVRVDKNKRGSVIRWWGTPEGHHIRRN